MRVNIMPGISLILIQVFLTAIAQDVLATTRREVVQPIVTPPTHDYVDVESPNLENSDAQSDQECFCIYDYENSFVKARVGNRTLKKGDPIMRGETVSLECRYANTVQTWKNGLRFFGRAIMNCSSCEKWQNHDLPTCKPDSRIDAKIGQEEDLAILPGGTVQLQKGESRQFYCSNVLMQPQWIYDGKKGVSVTKKEDSTDGKPIYVSYLDITHAEDEHSGIYECFARSSGGRQTLSTFLHLQVVEKSNFVSCPEHPVHPRVRVTYSDSIRIGSVATFSCSSSSGKLVGSSFSVCLERGTWSHPQPSCRDVHYVPEDCFCTYGYDDSVVKAQIGERRLKSGDAIGLNQTVAFECTVIGTTLTWQNGLRINGKAHMICSTCKEWERQDVPICETYEKGDTTIISHEDLSVLPGGMVIVQKGERHLFSCGSSQRYPKWDYGLRKGVYVDYISGSESTYYVSTLVIDKEADELSGKYECYIRGVSGQRLASTLLDLQVNETDISCPEVDKLGIFTLRYSNERRIHSTVSFHCKDNRKKIEGRSSLTCLPNGTWSGHYPKCVDNPVCAAPPPIAGTITPELKGSEHPPGTTVTYNCPLGYVSRNSANHISACKINEVTKKAEWEAPEIKCNPRSCGDPGYVDNGRRIGNLFTFPNKVDYECEEGYKLRGLKSRYCQAGGEWSGRLPSCEPIYCNVPADPVNGRVVYSSREYGTELKYECNAGFLLKTHEVRMCSEDGTWSRKEPECIEATCEEPQPPKHGTVKLHGDLKVNTLATYSCNPGRKLYGTATTKCMASGEWTFDAPECLGSCTVPFIENGEMGRYETKYTKWGRREEFMKVLAGENVESRETLIFRCNNGALPADNSQILENNRLQVTCNDGTWSKDLQCKRTRCLGEPPSSKNARTVIGSRDHGFTIHYTCNTRSATKIPGNVTCHFGSWIGIPPKCLNHPCNKTDLNYPGLVKPSEEHFNSFEYFEIHCEKGYKKQARVYKITCQRGKWDISQNPCTFETEESVINPSSDEVPISHGGEIEPSVNVESSSRQTIDVNRNRECFCTHEFDDSVKAEKGNKTLRRSDMIKRGEIVSLKCNSGSKFLTWQNGFRFYGNASMTCNPCRKWHREDLPTCYRAPGDTFIRYDGDLKILPGGIIDQPRGENRRYICASDVSPPVWNHGDRKDVYAQAYQINDRKKTWFVSELDILRAGNKHNGEYECFIRGDHGSHVGSTNFHLQVHDEEDKSISTTEPGLTSFFSVTQPSVNVETSTRQTSEAKRNEDCFCTYEYADSVVKAQIGDRRLKSGDTIRLNQRVSFECTFIGTALTWQNGLRLYGKAHMICSTCKKWQWQDVPICKNYEKSSDTIIISHEDLSVLPGGMVIVQKGERHQFSCCSSLIYPSWDYSQRKNVSVNYTSVSGSGSNYYVSTLVIDKEEDELRGKYECYIRDDNGRRSASTSLDLQVNETGICCPEVDRLGIFTLRYSNERRIHSTVTFHCKDIRKKIEGKSSLTCLPNGTWSGHYPKCVDYDNCPEFPNSTEVKVTYSNGLSVHSMAVFECSLRSKHLSGSQSSMCQDNGSWSNPFPLCEDWKCSIHNLSMSIPESVELDMSNVTEENVTIGSEVRLKCSENLVLIGDSKAQCGEQEKWKLGNFQCVNGCVLNLDPSSHLNVTPKKDSYRTGDFIYLSCPPDEETSYKVEVIMCMSGRWSDKLPECVAL